MNDFNGDGIADLYAAQHGWDEEPFPGSSNLLLLSGAGGTITNRASTNLVPDESTGFTHSAASADVDCDGDIDIYEGDLFGGGPHLQINNENGSFVAEDDRLPPKIASSELDILQRNSVMLTGMEIQTYYLGKLATVVTSCLSMMGSEISAGLPKRLFPKGFTAAEILRLKLDLRILISTAGLI